VDIPHLFLATSTADVQDGDINLDDFATLESYLWSEIQFRKEVTYLYVGKPDGEFFGVELLDDQFVVRLRDETTGEDRVSYYLDGPGQRATEPFEAAPYDPRERDWYQVAQRTGQPTWSPVFQAAARPVLIIVPVSPIYNESGELLGVWAINLTLSQISQFLGTLDVGKTGETFIMERDGNIIASSIVENPFIVGEDGRPQRLRAAQSQNFLIREAATYLETAFGPLLGIQEPYTQIMEIEDEIHYLHATPFQDGRGLDWIVVTIIPEADFIGPVQARIRTTIRLIILIVVLAIIIGLAAARWIIRPILALNEAALSIEQEVYDLTPLPPVARRNDEMGQLARVFLHMAEQVYRREQKLKKEVQKLRIEIDETKTIRQVKEILDSDFFKGIEKGAEQMRAKRQSRRQGRESQQE
jgi:HAMP domain-containing protein